jgi:hypothetical protein
MQHLRQVNTIVISLIAERTDLTLMVVPVYTVLCWNVRDH